MNALGSNSIQEKSVNLKDFRTNFSLTGPYCHQSTLKVKRAFVALARTARVRGAVRGGARGAYAPREILYSGNSI